MEIYINQSEFVKYIGKGSFSTVSLYQNKSNYFVIKEININKLVEKYKKSEEDIEYYYNRLEELIDSEIYILKNLKHKNITEFYGYSKKNKIYYLYLEYCNNGDMYNYLKLNKTREKNTYDGVSGEFLNEFLKQTIDAIDYIHTLNIIHRDIKLHNILLHKINGKIIFKLTDFGFACYDNTRISDNILSEKYYKLCGTPYYMAPEIILNMHNLENITNKGKDIIKISKENFYDKRIDIWSYGVCIYELVFNNSFLRGIKTIYDMEKFYNSESFGININAKLNKINDTNLKTILYNIFKIDYTKRIFVSELKEHMKFDFKIEINKNESSLFASKSNLSIKQHIVRKPIVEIESEVDGSWEKINNPSVMLTKIGFKDQFINWLNNNK